MQTTYEKLGGTYRQGGDYLLPNIEPPESPQASIWGERRRRYLREHNKVQYAAMLLGDTLNAHLEEVDQSAEQMFDRLVEQMKIRDGITEILKAADPLEWVRRLYTIRQEAAATVTGELICR